MGTYTIIKELFGYIIMVQNKQGIKYRLNCMEFSNHFPILMCDLNKIIKQYGGISQHIIIFHKEKNAQKFLDEVIMPYEIAFNLIK